MRSSMEAPAAAKRAVCMGHCAQLRGPSPILPLTPRTAPPFHDYFPSYRLPFSIRPISPCHPPLVLLASFASLGFTADPRISIERAANNLLKDAASLLVYQEVLRVPPAQAFLKVLLGLRRGDEGWKLLDAYGEFYKLMAAGQFVSWEELILEGILVGEGNPFAEASANVGNFGSQWSGGAPPSLQAAAAADLDSLQRLSVAESTLVGWVTDLVPDVRPEWKAAAESTLSSRDVKKAPFLSGEERRSDESKVSKPDSSILRSDSNTYSVGGALSIHNSGNGASAFNRETWRRKIGSLWLWSEAVPLLEGYYLHHGIGRAASEHAFHCKGGKLLQDFSFYAFNGHFLTNLSILKENREKLYGRFEGHILLGGSDHILLYGPSGSGRTSLVKFVLHGLVKKGILRMVQMHKTEMKHLQNILEELGKNWQLRYVLVVDGLPLTDDAVLMHDWPENVMLCGISLSASPREPSIAKISDNLRDMFGTILTLDDLDMESFVLTVEEMLEHKKELGQKPIHGTYTNLSDQAILWAKDRRVLTVRSAAQFVRSILQVQSL